MSKVRFNMTNFFTQFNHNKKKINNNKNNKIITNAIFFQVLKIIMLIRNLEINIKNSREIKQNLIHCSDRADTICQVICHKKLSDFTQISYKMFINQ